jgi:hypothetical protein
MSLSVNSTHSHNPLAQLQSLLQQGTAQSGSATQSDPLSQLLGAIDQQTGDASSSTTGSASPTGSSGVTPQFDQQMMQALLAIQADLSNVESLTSQLGGSAGSTASSGAADPTQSGGGQNPLDMLTSQAGTSQTVANSNGTSTTTITYADGSSVTTTTAAGSSTSSGGSAAAAGLNPANNNLLEQLIQMQAQLLNTTTPQSIMTV